MSDGWSAGALKPAQDSLDACHQLPRSKGLGNVIVGAHLQAEHAVVFRGASGQEDDGHNAQRRVLTQATAEIKAIAAGNHNIQQEKSGRLPLGIGKNLTDRQIRANGETGAFQVILDQPGDIWIIFQHENRLTQCLNLDC